MSQYKLAGVVDSSFSKDKTSKAGKPFKVHYVTVDGITVSTGFNQLFQQGEMINTTVEKKYGEWQTDGTPGGNLPDVSTAPPDAPKMKWTGGGSGFAKKTSTFPVGPTDGQMSIIRQNSMNRAVEILKQWQDSGMFSPKTEDEYLKKLIEVALTVTDFNSGQDIMKMQAAMAGNLAVVGQ